MVDRRLVATLLCALLGGWSGEALAQGGGPQFRVLSPLAGSLVGDSVDVRIAITSQTLIAAAGAILGRAGGALVAGSGSELRGALDASTLPRGSAIVVITVRDVNSRSTTTRIPVVIDRKPVLAVTAPAEGTVFTPSNAGTRFAASCADDGPGGCAALRVVFNGTVVATGRSAIDVTLSKLPHSATGADTALFIGTDTAGQTVQKTVGVLYESSARLVPVLEAPGPILDASADRVLFTDPQRRRLTIRHRDTQADEQIQPPAGSAPVEARLTPHGAAFVAVLSTVEPVKICEWRDGALVVLGETSATTLAGSQRFMAWVEQDASHPDQPATLRLRDLEAGTNEIVDSLDRVPSTAAAGVLSDVDVSSNGVVTYWKLTDGDYQVWRYSGGARAEVTDAPGTWSVGPRSDGTLTAYKHTSQVDSAAARTQLQVAGGSLTLADWPFSYSFLRPRAGADYQVRDGYVAFTRPAGGEMVSFWARAPDGSERLIWPSAKSAINSIGPNGVVLFGAGKGSDAGLYEAAPGRLATRICGPYSHPIWIDDALYVATERLLFKVAPAAARPLLTIDTPRSGAAVQPFAVSGWALDRDAADASGIDTVHVWAFPASGAAPTFMGAALMNISRPDVASAYGAQFAHAGFSLRIAGLAPGSYRLTAYAHSAHSNAFVTSSSTTVSVPFQVRVAIDTPTSGVVPRTFAVAGWALDGSAASGTGIDAVQVYAYASTGAAIYLGGAIRGAIRPDVAAAFGPAFARAGYGLVVERLAPGHYTLAVFARSAVTGRFAPAATRAITVSP